MARYIGPKSRIAHRRRKTSEYGVMLAEKQKAKYTYGVLEKQFRNMFEKASRASGITGEILLQNLECRLDNVVFRLGIAPTRAAARQLVNHKHITVDGKVVGIASYNVTPGQIVGVRERSRTPWQVSTTASILGLSGTRTRSLVSCSTSPSVQTFLRLSRSS